jgi:hypothetical protein
MVQAADPMKRSFIRHLKISLIVNLYIAMRMDLSFFAICKKNGREDDPRTLRDFIMR